MKKHKLVIPVSKETAMEFKVTAYTFRKTMAQLGAELIENYVEEKRDETEEEMQKIVRKMRNK